MPSSCYNTPPRSSNTVVQPFLTKMTRMDYHRSKVIHRTPLALLANATNTTVSARYLQELLCGNREGQKLFSQMEIEVKENAQEIFSFNNLSTQFEQKVSPHQGGTTQSASIQ